MKLKNMIVVKSLKKMCLKNKTSLLSILLLMLVFGCNQDEHREFYPNGNLKTSCSLDNGMLSGTAKYYYETGELHRTCQFVNNVKEGDFRVYYKDGIVMAESQYVNGQENGVRKDYFENGNIEFISKLDDGLYHGEQQMFYQNGNLKKLALFEKGQIVFEETRDSLGTTGDIKRQLIVRQNTDTLILGETLSYEVIYPYPEENEKYVFYVKQVDKYVEMSSDENGKAKGSFTPQSLENQKFEGQLPIGKNQNGIPTYLIFEAEVYVKPPKNSKSI